jgi:alpha(1,3/1,4) fucosyltransferase
MKKVCFKYWPRENEKHFFKKMLEKFDTKIVSEKEAEVMFFSTFDGTDSRKMPSVKFDGTKVFWTGENCRVDMKKTDYGFGFDYEENIRNEKYLRLPLYVYYGGGKDLLKGKEKGRKYFDRKFCNYTYSKDAKERVELFKELNKYKKVDAPGKSQHNAEPIPASNFSELIKFVGKIEGIFGANKISSLMSRHLGNWRQEVMNYQKNYKFTIAFENSEYAGYTTEKIYHPMLANSIPIYWGNPEIGRDFNTKSFVNYYDYNDIKKVADKVIELDQDEKKYLKVLNEPCLKGNKLNKWMDLERIEKQFEKILNERIK